ncbi:MAG TPA: RDD family protein [Pyrinomonadaceae bacterium]|nr:RDD family protein [Pyrinomonadaceae bacterium]
MECTSCGSPVESVEFCADCGAVGDENRAGNRTPTNGISTQESIMSRAEEATDHPKPGKSKLIEFPGANRNSIPEWRKELSERVREVQERRAREALEAAEAERNDTPDNEVPPQLELLPPAETPAMNPLVAAALKRIERAHQPLVSETRQGRAATAVAYAPLLEEMEPLQVVQPTVLEQVDIDAELDCAEPELEIPIVVEKPHNLVVVPAAEIPELPTRAAPKRLILDDPNDPALNYLDSVAKNVCVDQLAHSRASAFRRLVCAVFDLLICAALSAPIAFAIEATGNNLREPRTLAVIAGCYVLLTFFYLTLTTALTGRTLAMRLLSLRVIDRKTGLIPTGGQSIGRSFIYLLSLATAGIGIVFAVISREGYTAHDHFTRTAVIIT